MSCSRLGRGGRLLRPSAFFFNVSFVCSGYFMLFFFFFFAGGGYRLSQMISDKAFHGVSDQGRGCLLVFDELEADTEFSTYGAAIDTFEQVGKVVDSLYAKTLSYFCLAFFVGVIEVSCDGVVPLFVLARQQPWLFDLSSSSLANVDRVVSCSRFNQNAPCLKKV